MNDIKKRKLAWFLFMEEFDGIDQSLLRDVSTTIQAYLQQLLNAFDGYFSLQEIWNPATVE